MYVNATISSSFWPAGVRWGFTIRDEHGAQLAHGWPFMSQRRAWQECNKELRRLGYEALKWKEVQPAH